MFIDYDLKKSLEDINIEKIILQRKLLDNEKEYQRISDLINKSAVFDSKIILLLAELLSYKGRIEFTPFTYVKSGSFFTEYEETYGMGIAPKYAVYKYLVSGDERIDEFLRNEYSYEIIRKTKGFSNKKTESKILNFGQVNEDMSKNIKFYFLLNDYGVKCNTYYNGSIYDFKDYEYVQDFISYLFNIQLSNSAKQLTYEEMCDEMHNYLEMNKTRILK